MQEIIIDKQIAIKNESSLRKSDNKTDSLLIFITEKCRVGDINDKSCRIKCSDFYHIYDEWCTFSDNPKPKRDLLRTRMQAKGYKIIKNSVDYYRGIEFVALNLMK